MLELWRHISSLHGGRHMSVVGTLVEIVDGALGRGPSTVSREIQRNRGWRRYRAYSADATARERAKRPKTCKLDENRALARIVASKLQFEWAP